ncbi:MAG: hypothetical protein HFI31_05530 [Lachnospiraceae bacterium]|jgi:hypothetical protein|nr:hypothetical protein [Lachnospiraceae bacterium]MCI8995904.1 hypothetical protein [Lachnospiraceae bacterium]MCI9133634.1 hypothetical protein [Lachnospiraceae bacterium]
MDRNEFISILRGTLQGEIPDSAVEEHVEYYYHYISEEIGKGKSEAQVMELLGDPRLIARTIIDTAGTDGYGKTSRTYTESAQTYQKGFHAQENEEGGVDVRFGRLKLNTWYGKLVVIAVIVLVMVLIFTIVGGILSLVLPILIPVLVIVFVVRMLTDRR